MAKVSAEEFFGKKPGSSPTQNKSQVNSVPITSNEDNRSFGQKFATGVAKKELGIVRNIGKAGQELLQQTAGRVVEKITGKDRQSLGSSIYEGDTPEALQPKGAAEKAGAIATDVASLAVPGSAITKVAKGAQAAVRGASTVSKVAGLGARAAVEGVGNAATVALQQGKIDNSARDAAILSAIFPTASAAIQAGKKLKIGSKAGARLINSLVKPATKNLSYGKNPGRAVAEEGITGSSLEELTENISKRRNEVGVEIKRKISESARGGEIIDFSDALDPIDQAIEVAKRAPRTNAAKIQRLQDVKDDLLRVTSNEAGEKSIGRTLEGTADKAFDFKQDIGDLTKYTGNPSDDEIVNRALQQSYSNVRKKIEEIIPDIKQVNEKYGDLTAAEVAARNRDAIMQRQNLVGLSLRLTGYSSAVIAAITTGGVGPLLIGGLTAGLDKALASPGIKTRVAKWLANASPAEKKKIFDAAPAFKAAVIRGFVGD